MDNSYFWEIWFFILLRRRVEYFNLRFSLYAIRAHKPKLFFFQFTFIVYLIAMTKSWVFNLSWQKNFNLFSLLTLAASASSSSSLLPKRSTSSSSSAAGAGAAAALGAGAEPPDLPSRLATRFSRVNTKLRRSSVTEKNYSKNFGNREDSDLYHK